MDPKKVGDIMECPTPTNVPEVHSFMGLAGYYRSFVKGFLKIENLITELQKKNKKFVWIEKCRSISEAQGVVYDNIDTKGP